MHSVAAAVPALALALAFAVPDADAQNLLPNGDFRIADPVQKGWAFDPDIHVEWSALDRFGGGPLPFSGSMKATMDCSPPCAAPVASQDCFAASPGDHFVARGSSFIPAQTATPTARVELVFYDTTGACQSVDIVETVPVLATQATDVWVDGTVEVVAPDPVTGVRFRLVVEEAAVPNAVAHFDELFLPEPRPGLGAGVALGALAALALGRHRGAPATLR
jgi:hypothetical protein